KVFDPEFAFYGPMGYDIGNVIANMYFAWNNANAMIEDKDEKGSYLKWIEETISEIIDLFIEKYNYIYDKNVKEPMAMIEGFKEWYLSNILKDTSAVIGLELIRRIVGLANVKDVTSILDEEKRIWAEKVCILA